MEKISEIKIPKGVNRIAVKQHDDKIVIEFIPEELKFKRGDILSSDSTILIFDKYISCNRFSSLLHSRAEFINDNWYMPAFRYASIEEIEVFYKDLARMGKRWNAETLELEDILKKGDLAIFWGNDKAYALIRIYGRGCHEYHYDNRGTVWENAVKFESKEQFEKILRGEI